MPDSKASPDAPLDAIVVGAGFAGMYMLHRLRQAGFNACVLESAPDVGGTWYANRYPGCRCDVDSLLYSYTFDPELSKEWRWPEKYSAAGDIQRYARFVAERLDLLRSIRFNTRVTAITWNEDALLWEVTTEEGAVFRAGYAVLAVGCLSTARMPDIPGRDRFVGEVYHTGDWPTEPVDLEGKRVAVLGTGSSGIQVIPEIAREAKHLTVLQRTPNYIVPSRNGPMTDSLIAETDAMMKKFAALATTPKEGEFVPGLQPRDQFSPEERQEMFERQWQAGGPLFGWVFANMMVDPDTNEEACAFIRAKIRAIVKDPAVAERLTPRGYPMHAKRLCIESGYYETFNSPHVELIDTKASPILEMTKDGLTLADGRKISVDAIVFATGFKAMTGSILRLNITGVGGKSLHEAWRSGPETYLGLAVSGFPNLFIFAGPGSPSVIGNVIHNIEQHVDWLARLLSEMAAKGLCRVEADSAAQAEWTREVDAVANRSLWPHADSWYLGPDRNDGTRMFMPYCGGGGAFRVICDDIVRRGYPGLNLSVPSRRADLGQRSASPVKAS